MPPPHRHAPLVDPVDSLDPAPAAAPPARRRPGRARSRLILLGPAFVAAIAYVDPGNVATGATAGASYGYLLVWVVVVANVMAGIIQYLSAKLGLVTGGSLPAELRRRLPRWARLGYWAQAELVAMATDLAEVVGGALALYLLFGLPLPLGAVITVAVSTLLLVGRDLWGQRTFERTVLAALVVIAVGFAAGLVTAPPSPGGIASGLVPRFAGTESVLLAAGMLGATVMPHAVYLHSALAVDRHGATGPGARRRRLLVITRWDVGIAMVLAGSINLSVLLVGATTLADAKGEASVEGLHGALGGAVALIFAIGLLASGLASTAVGNYSGAVVMEALTTRRIPLAVRRLVTAVPAVALLLLGADPTWSLVLSQVVLSFGIPFAVVPLVMLTARRAVMGADVNARATTVAATVAAVAIVALNLALIWLTVLDLAG